MLQFQPCASYITELIYESRVGSSHGDREGHELRGAESHLKNGERHRLGGVESHHRDRVRH